MVFWSVLCFVLRALCLTPAPLALSLLRNLCHEPLGYHSPLPHVPQLLWYVLEFSEKR